MGHVKKLVDVHNCAENIRMSELLKTGQNFFTLHILCLQKKMKHLY